MYHVRVVPHRYLDLLGALATLLATMGLGLPPGGACHGSDGLSAAWASLRRRMGGQPLLLDAHTSFDAMLPACVGGHLRRQGAMAAQVAVVAQGMVGVHVQPRAGSAVGLGVKVHRGEVCGALPCVREFASGTPDEICLRHASKSPQLVGWESCVSLQLLAGALHLAEVVQVLSAPGVVVDHDRNIHTMVRERLPQAMQMWGKYRRFLSARGESVEVRIHQVYTRVVACVMWCAPRLPPNTMVSDTMAATEELGLRWDLGQGNKNDAG